MNIFADATHDRQWIHVEPACGVLVELEGSDRPACVTETVVIYQ